MIAAGTVLSGCSGAEFGVIDSTGVDRDGALDSQAPTHDRHDIDGVGGAGGKGGSGGTGASGGGGSGGTGASGTDGGGDDGPDDDETGTNDGAPSDNGVADTSNERGDTRGGADSDRSGDVSDVHPIDTPTGDAPTAADAKDAATDIASDGRRDSSLGSDARDGSTDLACSEPIVFYADEDGDGFGTNSVVTTSCVAPGNGWTTLGGDCRDDLPSVKPFQSGWPNPPQYSGTGYADSAKPQGISFDYDCTGAETPDPSNPYGPVPDCGGLLDCKGVGYLPLNPARTGPGIDARCGSTTLQRCNGKLLGNCGLDPPEVTSIPYRCR